MSLEHIQGSKRKELLALPVIDWELKTTYDSILILSDGKKHDSGWGLITVIGCLDMRPIEIAANCCDDINWKINHEIRTDCILPSRAIHFWARNHVRFTVGIALSSTEIITVTEVAQ